MAAVFVCTAPSSQFELDFCKNSHNGRPTIHVDGLCPENYPELKNTPNCWKCKGLLEQAIPGASTGVCTRGHKFSHWDRTPHSDRWCPEQNRSKFCSC